MSLTMFRTEEAFDVVGISARTSNTVLLGARVSSLDDVPDGMTVCHVPAQKCMIITTERGPVAKVVLQAWQNIWDLEDQKKLHRLYRVDYQLHDERSADPSNAEVEIHVGVVQ